ncbi:hypothetical protein MLD38_023083 [Melastoma candidum]|uniref:Uncharacterized protein n=1 Tax=Melastoma candidum TaxID=119954 RepID=A0ACB9QLK0_9MYRT|nr:hypothetical protein MLD38_023083 [Melastoma candidum]
MAIVMALLSGFAGVYTEAIIKKRPSRNINVQNFWLYIFGMIFNIIAILVQDFSAVLNNGIAVSMVMKYADNIVKVYSTSVAMLLTAVVSVFLFDFTCPSPSSLVLLSYLSQYTCIPLGSCGDSDVLIVLDRPL